jgi:myo-inositol-1(or 4)-monophosphatase
VNNHSKIGSDLQGYLNMLVEIAREAGASIRPGIDQEIITDLRRDIKIKADVRLNKIIIDRLKKESPYPVLSEEGGFSENKSGDNEFHWIVDPLDGSLNFSRTIPLCCISIALWKEMDPLVGVVYDFNRDEMFVGLVGTGAWLNDKPMKVGKVAEKKNAILCTGFPVNTDFSENALLSFVKKIQSYKKVRLFGSAALSLAYVASGRADFYWENDISMWDVAAGVAIVKAAGGIVQFSATQTEKQFVVKAGNKFLTC